MARRYGFTLIEMLAVLVLAGLLAAVAGVSLRGAGRAATLDDALGQLEQFDRLTRQQARRLGRPMQMAFDLRRHEIKRFDAERQQERGAALRLGDGFELSRVVTADESISAGELTVPCSAHGYTPTYALCVTTTVDGNDQQTWLLFAGLTGSTLRLTDDDQVDRTFDLLRADNAAGRHDAD